MIFNFFKQIFSVAKVTRVEEVKASRGCHGIGKELALGVSLKSSHPCDNG